MEMSDLSVGIRRTLTERAGERGIEFRGRWLTWAEIAAYADGVTRLLRTGGMPPDAPLAVVARNRPPHAGIILGAIAESRNVSMIYAFQSPEAIAADIRRLRPHAVVADREDWTPIVMDAARSVGALGIAVSVDDPTVAAVDGLEHIGAGPHRAIPQQPGFELLSSGTTGAPKRVLIPIPAFIRGVAASTLGARPDPTAPPVVSVLFWPFGNISVLTLIAQAYLGNPVVLLEKFTVQEAVRAIEKYRVRSPAAPPPVVRQILEARVPREALASLEMVFGGSAALEPEAQERFEAEYEIPVLWGYGATEFAGTAATWTPALRKEFGNSKRGSVGRALAGAKVRVVDPVTGDECPRGVHGLLEAQIEILGPEWIRTTDLASMDEDDFVFLHGRADGAIFRGGFKIIPERVVDVLRLHPAVRDAAVVGLPDPVLGQVPAAAIEARPRTNLSSSDIQAHVRAHLPAHHIPARVLFTPELPRTPSMKVSLPAVVALFAGSARD